MFLSTTPLTKKPSKAHQPNGPALKPSFSITEFPSTGFICTLTTQTTASLSSFAVAFGVSFGFFFLWFFSCFAFLLGPAHCFPLTPHDLKLNAR